MNNLGGNVSPNATGKASFIAEIQDSIFSKSVGFTVASAEIHNAVVWGAEAAAKASQQRACCAATTPPCYRASSMALLAISISFS